MSPQLLRETKPTARKPHRCSTCGGPIRSGDIYTRATLVYDARLYDWLDCPACVADHVWAYVADWCGCGDTNTDCAQEWACEAVIHGAPAEQAAAKRYLERRAS